MCFLSIHSQDDDTGAKDEERQKRESPPSDEEPSTKRMKSSDAATSDGEEATPIEEDGACPVKEEPMDVDAQPELPTVGGSASKDTTGKTKSTDNTGGSASKDGESSGKNLYEAILVDLFETDMYASHWGAKIEYGQQSYFVDSDMLQPAKEETPKDDVKFAALPQISCFGMFETYSSAILIDAVSASSCQCMDSMSGVRVERKEIADDKKDGAGASYRVRALKDFQPNQLVLPPFASAQAHYVKRVPKRKKNADGAKSEESASMGGPDDSQAQVKFKKVRVHQDTEAVPPPTVNFTLKSPLSKLQEFKNQLNLMNPDVDRKDISNDDCHQWCSPFWALQQTTKTSAVNMELYKVKVESTAVHPFGIKKMPYHKQAAYTCTFFCARNTKRIKKGEILERSVMQQSHSDSESE